MEKRTRVLIADDHPIFRAGLKVAIEADRAFEIVGEASDGAEALRLMETETPDIVVLDVNMPELSGFEVLKEMKRLKIAAGAVMLTMHKDEAMFAKGLDLGARGYVLKDSAMGDIVQCLHAVRRGESYASPAVTSFLFKKVAGETLPEGLESLTPTERKILRMVAEYKTSSQIADELCVSVHTIENHRTNISSKLGVRGSHALIKFAHQHISEI